MVPLHSTPPLLEEYEKKQLNKIIKKVLEKYSFNIQERAASYLYIKETRSSYALEHERPTLSRMQRFIKLLSNSNRIAQLLIEHVPVNSLNASPISIALNYSDSKYEDLEGLLKQFGKDLHSIVSAKPTN